MAAATGFHRLFFASALLFSLVGTCYGDILFKSLKRTLEVTSSPHNGSYLKAGESVITLTWGSWPNGTESLYESVKAKLCYAPISQQDRAWRITKEPISKDKTCQFKIASPKYNGTTTVKWLVQRDTPTAYYFIRVYALDKAGHEVAYGQTTDDNITSNFFFVEAVTGRHVSLDIASATFSAFSVISLMLFFYLEKRKGKSASKN